MWGVTRSKGHVIETKERSCHVWREIERVALLGFDFDFKHRLGVTNTKINIKWSGRRLCQ